MRVLSVEATGISLYFVSINLKGQVLIYVGVEGVSMVASKGPSKFVPCFPGLLWITSKWPRFHAEWGEGPMFVYMSSGS